MKIQVTFELDEDATFADPSHKMGVTNECYEYLVKVIPGDDVDVVRVHVIHSNSSLPNSTPAANLLS